MRETVAQLLVSIDATRCLRVWLVTLRKRTQKEITSGTEVRNWQRKLAVAFCDSDMVRKAYSKVRYD